MRLRNILLLVLRMLVIVLAVVLIAMPFLPDFSIVAISGKPAAVVVIIDNSGSMRYAKGDQSLSDQAAQRVIKMLRDQPADSKFAVISTQKPFSALGFTSNRDTAISLVKSCEKSAGARSISGALAKASSLLSEIHMPEKKLIIVSDLTRQSWASAGKAKLDSCCVTVIDAGADNPVNFSLGEITLSDPQAPAGSLVSVKTYARSTNLQADLKATLRINGKPVESKTVSVAPGADTPIEFIIPIRKAGINTGSIELSPADNLKIDNRRFFAIYSQAPGKIGFVKPAGRYENDCEFIMTQAICPAGERSASNLAVNLTPSDILTDKLKPCKLVVLANLRGLSAQQWRALAKHIKAGASLWIIAGNRIDPELYDSPDARVLCPARFGKLHKFAKPGELAEPDYSDRFLQPFAQGTGNPPLSDLRFYKRFDMDSFAEDAHVSLRYEDKTPAIISRFAGAGRVVVWNFSPAREFSNLAELAGQLVILADQTRIALQVRKKLPAEHRWGQRALVKLPKKGEIRKIFVTTPAGYRVKSTFNEEKRTLETAKLTSAGVYRVIIETDAGKNQLPVVVNCDQAESELARITPKKLASHFPPGALATYKADQQIRPGESRKNASLDLVPPAILLLLLAMIAESYLANRFYRGSQNDDSQKIS